MEFLQGKNGIINGSICKQNKWKESKSKMQRERGGANENV